MMMKNKEKLTFYRISRSTTVERPYFEVGVKAGFPSPAEEYEENPIDLNKELIKNPPSTFFCRVDGVSMQDLGIDDGDLLVVDRSVEPTDGKIAVCYIDGEFTLKKIKFEKDHCWLIPGNKNYRPIKVTEENEFIIWGIVVHSVKSF
jgi:DNA polymerase V